MQDPHLTVDIHTHILPENWPDLKERYGYGGFVRLEHHKPCCARMMVDNKFFREIEDNCWDPEKRIKDCRKDKVDIQVLSTVPIMFSYWAKPSDTSDLSQILNNHLAQVVGAYPDRFVGLATLPMQHPKYAVKELERSINELGLSGIQIGSHINHWNLDAPEVVEILEAAQDLGACVFIHPWDMMGKSEMPKYWLPWLVGMPAEQSRAICSLIFGGVFEKLPKLRIAFAHGGGSFPSSLGRIEQGFKVRPDLCAVENEISPKKYLGKFYLDTLVHDKEMLEYIIKLNGVDKMLLGTDYPFPLGEKSPGALVNSLSLNSRQKDKILGLNALDWLGLPSKHFTQASSQTV